MQFEPAAAALRFAERPTPEPARSATKPQVVSPEAVLQKICTGVEDAGVALSPAAMLSIPNGRSCRTPPVTEPVTVTAPESVSAPEMVVAALLMVVDAPESVVAALLMVVDAPESVVAALLMAVVAPES